MEHVGDEITFTPEELTYVESATVDAIEAELQRMIGVPTTRSGTWVDNPIPLAIEAISYGVTVGFIGTGHWNFMTKMVIRQRPVFVAFRTAKDSEQANRSFAALICVALRRCDKSGGGEWKSVKA